MRSFQYQYREEGAAVVARLRRGKTTQRKVEPRRQGYGNLRFWQHACLSWLVNCCRLNVKARWSRFAGIVSGAFEISERAEGRLCRCCCGCCCRRLCCCYCRKIALKSISMCFLFSLISRDSFPFFVAGFPLFLAHPIHWNLPCWNWFWFVVLRLQVLFLPLQWLMISISMIKFSRYSVLVIYLGYLFSFFKRLGVCLSGLNRTWVFFLGEIVGHVLMKSSIVRRLDWNQFQSFFLNWLYGWWS